MAAQSPSTNSEDRASASALELTQQCISLFETCVASPKNGGGTAMQTRLADVRLWADGVGAIAEGTASLDWRFHNREQDLLLVKTILIMLADFAEDYATLLSEDKPTDDALERIDSTIENLALIGVAIRRTGKASRRRRADTRFDPKDYEELRRHLECVILLRPSKSGLQGELNLSNLSIVQKRLIEANLKRRHRFVIAQKRFRKVEEASQQRRNTSLSQDDTTSKGGSKDTESRKNREAETGRKQGHGQRAPTTKGGLTAASTAEGTLEYGKRRRYVPGAARTQITALAADAEFPRPPPNPEGRRIGKCPCCCQSLLVEEMMHPSKWRQHIVEDLLPYTCMVENCPTRHIAVFSTRKEWEAHVKTDHRVQWRCPLCEEDDIVVESEEAITHHFAAEHQDDLKELTLETLLPWSETQVMGISSCPLCSSYGREDSPEIIDHVLKHVYEFSLRALPWTAPFTHDLAKPIGTFKLPDDKDAAERLMEWVEVAEGHTAQELQLSAVEVDNDEMAFPEAIEDTGYVPDDEYFDAESAAKSSRPQLADTESSGYSSASYKSNNASNEGSIARAASVDSLGVCELPPAPDPPEFLDPEDLMDFYAPHVLDVGEESDDEPRRPPLEDIVSRARDYIQKSRVRRPRQPPTHYPPGRGPVTRRSVTRRPPSVDSFSDYETVTFSNDPETHKRPSVGGVPTRPRFPMKAPSPPGLDSGANSPHRPGSARGDINTWLDDTAQNLEQGGNPDIWADWDISRKDTQARPSVLAPDQRALPHMSSSIDDSAPVLTSRHPERDAELEGSTYESESGFTESVVGSVEGQDFIAGHLQPESDQAAAPGSLRYNPDDPYDF